MNESISIPVAQTVKPVTPEASSLSATETVTKIFFEPARVFESFRERPRFLFAAILIAAVIFAFSILFVKRAGYENIVRAKLEALQTAGLSEVEKEQIIQIQSRPSLEALSYASSTFNVFLMLFAGAFLYQVGSMATTRTVSYRQALAVWTYSSLPSTLVMTLLSILLLLMTPVDQLEPLKGGRSAFVHANLGVLVHASEHPILSTTLGAVDLFVLYGLILAALGLQKVARMSSTTAWGIVLTIWICSVAVRGLITAYTGLPLG